jgi:hypothetical protein
MFSESGEVACYNFLVGADECSAERTFSNRNVLKRRKSTMPMLRKWCSCVSAPAVRGYSWSERPPQRPKSRLPADRDDMELRTNSKQPLCMSLVLKQILLARVAPHNDAFRSIWFMSCSEAAYVGMIGREGRLPNLEI